MLAMHSFICFFTLFLRTHPVCNFFILWQPDGMASGSQLTNRMTPHQVYLVNNLWTGRQAVRFSNFKKWEANRLIRVSYQKLQSFLIKEGYLNNFNKDNYGIKILYGVREERLEEEFVSPILPIQCKKKPWA